MVDRSSPKKRVSQSSRTVRKTSGRKSARVKKSQEKGAAGSFDKTGAGLKAPAGQPGETADRALHDTLDSTKKQLGRLGERLHEATGKGIHMARGIAEDVHRFASVATEITRLRIDIHAMKKERDNLLMLMGEKLKNLYHARKLSNLRGKFSNDVRRLDKLEADIEDKETEADRLSADIRTMQ